MLVLHKNDMEIVTGRPYRHDGIFTHTSAKSEADYFYSTGYENTFYMPAEENVDKTLIFLKIYNYSREEIVVVGIKHIHCETKTDISILGAWHGLDTPVNIAKFRGKSILEAIA